MHRYQPRLHVIYIPGRGDPVDPSTQAFRTFIFPESKFTGVTAYQNHRVSYIFIYLFIYKSLYVYIYSLHIYLFIYKSIYLSIHL